MIGHKKEITYSDINGSVEKSKFIPTLSVSFSMHFVLINTLISLSVMFVYCQRFQYHAKYLQNDGDYELSWTADSRQIEMQLCKDFGRGFKTPLWMGIGFSDRGDTVNADLFAVDLNRFQSFDLHTNEVGRIVKDKINNYKLQQLYELNRSICFITKREINTCDIYDYMIDRGTTNILLFTSYMKGKSLETMEFTFLNPFTIYLQLLRSTIPVQNVPRSTPMIDVRLNQVEIPQEATTYWCRVMKLPKLKSKHHIIKFEAIISENSKGIVHHMELFHCTEDPLESKKEYNAPCNSESKPMGLTMCRNVIAAWAMGAKPFVYPQNVGNPIGGPVFSQYVILEIHFNNQKKQHGIIDSSGLRLFYTEQLRKFDAGIIELGLEYNDKNSIPPYQKEFVLSGYCLDKCTSKALPREGIFVFGSQLHTHLTGRKVETRHYRNDQELNPLNKDDHYQPHYQEIRLLPEIVHVLPGDTLVTSCTYQTANRSEMTLGGIEITNEMCVNYILYYPRIDFELCKSSISDLALEQFLDRPLDDLKEVFNEIKWTQYNTQLLQRLYYEAPIHQSCNMSDSESFQGEWDVIFPPIISTEDSQRQIKAYECLYKDFFF